MQNWDMSIYDDLDMSKGLDQFIKGGNGRFE